MSDPVPARLCPASRARRLRLAAGSAASLVLAWACGWAGVARPGAVLAAGAACGAGALWAARQAARKEPLPGADPRGGPESSEAGAERAVYVGPDRIVLQGPGRRRVVWRDATEPATFRRLAAHARWRGAAA